MQGDDGASSLIRRLSEVQEKLQKSETRVHELEKLLNETMAHLKATKMQLRERDQLHAQLQKVQQETQEALASMENTKAAMQEEVLQTKNMCQQLEERAQKATEKCRQLEDASHQDLERCEMLARQVEEAQHHCLILTQQINQMEMTKSVVAADHSTAPSSLLHLSDCDDIFNGTGRFHFLIWDFPQYFCINTIRKNKIHSALALDLSVRQPQNLTLIKKMASRDFLPSKVY